jgi:hypothetical protein
MGRWRVSRVCCAAGVASAVLASVGCDSNPAFLGGETEASMAEGSLAERVELNVRGVFILFEDPSEMPGPLAAFLGGPDLEFRVDDETVRGREALVELAFQIQAKFQRIDFEVGPVEVADEGEDIVRARFVVDRNGWDESGLRHVSRSRHDWKIRVDEHGAPVLIEAVAMGLVPHSGTGSRILCL